MPFRLAPAMTEQERLALDAMDALEVAAMSVLDAVRNFKQILEIEIEDHNEKGCDNPGE